MHTLQNASQQLCDVDQYAHVAINGLLKITAKDLKILQQIFERIIFFGISPPNFWVNLLVKHVLWVKPRRKFIFTTRCQRAIYLALSVD